VQLEIHIPVRRPSGQQVDLAAPFLNQHPLQGDCAGTELEARGVLDDEEQRDLALLDEFLPVGFAEAGGDVPVDVSHIVAELVLHHLVELHAAAAEGGAVLTAGHVLDGVAYTPLEATQPREGGGLESEGG